MCAAGFPEPYTFSLRVRRLLRNRRADFDVVHDNQCLGTGLAKMVDDGWPMLATLHHPITVDRDLDLAHAKRAWKRFTLRRWYGFLDMQTEVARQLPRLVTVSESSRRDIIDQMGVDARSPPRRPRRRRPRGVPAPAGRASRPRPHHDDGERRRPDEGPRAAARGGRQGAHRARRRAPRRDRQAEGQEPDPRR